MRIGSLRLPLASDMKSVISYLYIWKPVITPGIAFDGDVFIQEVSTLVHPTNKPKEFTGRGQPIVKQITLVRIRQEHA